MKNKAYVLSAFLIDMLAVGSGNASNQTLDDPEDFRSIYNSFLKQGAPVAMALKASESEFNRSEWIKYKGKKKDEDISGNYDSLYIQYYNDLHGLAEKASANLFKQKEDILEMLQRMIRLTNHATHTKKHYGAYVTDETLSKDLLQTLRRISSLCNYGLERSLENKLRPNFLQHAPLILRGVERSQNILKEEAAELHDAVASEYDQLRKYLQEEIS